MSLFPNRTISILRYSAEYSEAPTGGHYERGKWIPDESPRNQWELKTSRQPLSGRELQNLAEGYRLKVVFKYFPDRELYTADPAKGRIADQIIDGNEVFMVIACNPWQNGIINHYEVTAVRIKEIA